MKGIQDRHNHPVKTNISPCKNKYLYFQSKLLMNFATIQNLMKQKYN